MLFITLPFVSLFSLKDILRIKTEIDTMNTMLGNNFMNTAYPVCKVKDVDG